MTTDHRTEAELRDMLGGAIEHYDGGTYGCPGIDTETTLDNLRRDGFLAHIREQAATEARREPVSVRDVYVYEAGVAEGATEARRELLAKVEAVVGRFEEGTHHGHDKCYAKALHALIEDPSR